MKIKMGRADLFVMKILYESSSGLQPYTLLKRSKLSGEIFFKVFNNLVSSGLLEEKDTLISLNDQGRSMFLTASSMVMAGGRKWREIPADMRGRKLDKDEYYIPNISIM